MVGVHLTQRDGGAGDEFGLRNKFVGLRLVEDRDVEFVGVLPDLVLDLSAGPVFDFQLVALFFLKRGREFL